MVIAVDEGVKRVLNNEQLYFRLLNKFSGREMAEQIITATKDGDFKVAAAKCHALKGTAANLAMHPLADAVAQIEELLVADESPEGLFPGLYEQLEAVEEAIKEIVKT